jgi:hypothetical protein
MITWKDLILIIRKHQFQLYETLDIVNWRRSIRKTRYWCLLSLRKN